MGSIKGEEGVGEACRKVDKRRRKGRSKMARRRASALGKESEFKGNRKRAKRERTKEWKRSQRDCVTAALQSSRQQRGVRVDVN